MFLQTGIITSIKYSVFTIAVVAFAILSICSFKQASAQDSENAKSAWSAGIAGIGSLTPYRGVSSESLIVPIVAYEGERIIWRGPSFQYKFTGTERGEPSLRLSIELAPNELEASESNELNGIEDRNLSFLAGLRYVYPTAYGQFNAVYQTDITGEHNGQRGALNFERPIFQDPQRRWMINAGVQVEYLSSNYADYYFGISREEAARSIFEEYAVGAVWQGGITLGGYYQFNQDWQVIVSTRFLSLASDIKNSPIVEDDYTIDGFIGVTYQF
uniref:MipA/OmpV family protein n=1 Tax=Ningiella ruwaisensis TaxID=2364274 RepID=UPI00109EF735|nr:MipA/OmpV family protein [Ningiella ruwaisensis]